MAFLRNSLRRRFLFGQSAKRPPPSVPTFDKCKADAKKMLEYHHCPPRDTAAAAKKSGITLKVNGCGSQTAEWINIAQAAAASFALLVYLVKDTQAAPQGLCEGDDRERSPSTFDRKESRTRTSRRAQSQESAYAIEKLKRQTRRDKARDLRRQDTSQSSKFIVSACADRGHRAYMEDAFFVSPNKRFVAVFDGHGGAQVAEFLRSRLYPMLYQNILDRVSKALSSSVPILELPELQHPVRLALLSTFESLDNEVCGRASLDRMGATVTCVYLENDRIWTANLGDCRAVLCKHGGESVQLTRDHKPMDRQEKERIERLGGTVAWHGWKGPEGQPVSGLGAFRVNGNLAVARAIGDKDQRPFISGEPEIFSVQRDFERDHFIVVASDGLWDVIDNDQVATFVNNVMMSGIGARGSWKSGAETESTVSLPEWKSKYHDDKDMLKAAMTRRKTLVARYLVEEALNRGAKDNITVVILWLQ